MTKENLNKEEILQRSRNEKRDEGIEHIFSQRFKKSSGIFILILIAILILNVVMFRITDAALTLTILWTYIIVCFYAHPYALEHNRLLTLSMCAFAIVASFGTYIASILELI